ncbi:ATP-binding protein [Brachyspira aalborgi]|uniref:ATP-binding protein n=1 Tax=Brachyspira aalborgi TaxID=29522 RepID=A0A5C8F8F8_9SPIR|nr:DUF87 domain-containing protein [Brachyspira aalborgi]TXJ45694.1 ATP-binding protein [Brachyspira aalborgi]
MNIKNIFHNRFAILIILISLFMVIHYFLEGTLLPTTDTKDIWFYSGLGAMLFSLLFIEPYFTSPKNVLTNSLPLFLVFLSIKQNYSNKLVWLVIFIFICIMILSSILSMVLSEIGKNKSDRHIVNKISNIIKNFAVKFGQGKVLYSIIFISTLLIYYGGNRDDNNYSLAMFIFWSFVILIINPKNLNNSFSIKKKDKNIDAIGEIFAVQSNKIYLAKAFEDKKNINKFTTIKFKNCQDKTLIGFIFDIYELNNQQWVKICILEEISEGNDKITANVVYKIENKDLEIQINNFVGIVSENSNILKINFEYSKKERDLEEGDLLKVDIGGKSIYYQVVNGITNSEALETKNKSGFIRGEAIQLGEWDNKELDFKKFGWVADMYSPVFKVINIEKSPNKFVYPEYKLGVIQKTNIPSVINLHDAISHHIALIGVTGSGKSFLARELIKELMQDTKIICIDFNNEFIKYFNDINNIVNNEYRKIIQEKIDTLIIEYEKFANQQIKGTIKTCDITIRDNFKKSIQEFLKSNDKNISNLELPDLVNTTAILEYTKYFFKVIFDMAKNNETNDKKILIVIEEAHTIIPEWNFMGSNDKTSQSVINTISQIALQGRKYDIGFMIIGQRTANISKTILTQCNTMICFQAFDDTNFNFLGNYIGKDLAISLPSLKKYHAVVSGKAIKSNLPLIVDITRNELNKNVNE